MMGVAVDLPQGGGIHEIQMPADQLGKIVFRAIMGVTAEQGGVIHHGSSTYSTR
jgi:hypothetical protein